MFKKLFKKKKLNQSKNNIVKEVSNKNKIMKDEMIKSLIIQTRSELQEDSPKFNIFVNFIVKAVNNNPSKTVEYIVDDLILYVPSQETKEIYKNNLKTLLKIIVELSNEEVSSNIKGQNFWSYIGNKTYSNNQGNIMYNFTKHIRNKKNIYNGIKTQNTINHNNNNSEYSKSQEQEKEANEIKISYFKNIVHKVKNGKKYEEMTNRRSKQSYILKNIPIDIIKQSILDNIQYYNNPSMVLLIDDLIDILIKKLDSQSQINTFLCEVFNKYKHLLYTKLIQVEYSEYNLEKIISTKNYKLLPDILTLFSIIIAFTKKYDFRIRECKDLKSIIDELVKIKTHFNKKNRSVFITSNKMTQNNKDSLLKMLIELMTYTDILMTL